MPKELMTVDFIGGKRGRKKGKKGVRRHHRGKAIRHRAKHRSGMAIKELIFSAAMVAGGILGGAYLIQYIKTNYPEYATAEKAVMLNLAPVAIGLAGTFLLKKQVGKFQPVFIGLMGAGIALTVAHLIKGDKATDLPIVSVSAGYDTYQVRQPLSPGSRPDLAAHIW